MKKLNRLIVLFVCIAIIFITSFSVLGYFSHRRHGSCSGYGCVVCIQLTKAKEALNQLGHQAAAVFVLPLAIAFLISNLTFHFDFTLKTPVALKVRIDG